MSSAALSDISNFRYFATMSEITHPEQTGRALPTDLLTAYSDRLMTNQDTFNSGNVVICDQPMPKVMPIGDPFVTVSFTGGQFQSGLMSGGGHHQLTCVGTVTVAIFKRMVRDPSGRRGQVVHERGIWSLVQQVLALLTVETPSLGLNSQQWEPARNGRGILRSLPMPLGVSDCQDVQAKDGMGVVSVRWRVEFDWDVFR